MYSSYYRQGQLNMKALVDRFVSDDDTTISRVLVDQLFQCFGLEDEYREHKVAKETRIAAGSYQVLVRTFGGHHVRYSRRFSDIHQGMLEIVNVPNFTDILVHCGNTDEDTAGCLIIGIGANTEPGDMSISQSVTAYRRFYTLVIQAALDKNLYIEFQDNDR